MTDKHIAEEEHVGVCENDHACWLINVEVLTPVLNCGPRAKSNLWSVFIWLLYKVRVLKRKEKNEVQK